MYDVLLEQFQELPPSAKEPLFRRLMVEESLSYLREKNYIIGFEVDLNVQQTLSGFTLIAIQKHTIYAYRSDLGETPKLVLFPPLEKLFDPSFELLDLHVTKKKFTDSKFVGIKLASGVLQDLVKDLTPPQKQVDLPENTVLAMTEHMKHIQNGEQVVDITRQPETVPVKVTKEEEVKEEPVFEAPPEPEDFSQEFEEEDPYAGFEEGGYDSFDDYGGYEDYGESYDETEPYEEPYEEPEPESEPEPEMDERSKMLRAQTFQSLSEVSDFCSGKLGVSRPLAVNVVNKALQSEVAPEYRIELALRLFCKLFDEKRI